MPVIIDGNNLLHSLPKHQRHRSEVRRLALESVRRETMKVVLVFDGPPPRGTPDSEFLGRVTVRYSGASPADDVITAMLPDDRAASQWVVVTDDRGLRDRARNKGAAVRTLAEWQGRRRRSRRGHFESRLSSHEVAEWEAYFSGRDDDQER